VASLQGPASGGSALIAAVRAGNTSLVAALLNEDTQELEQADRAGFTALHHASSLGFVPIGRLLLKHGADANKLTKRKDTALTLARTEDMRDLFLPAPSGQLAPAPEPAAAESGLSAELEGLSDAVLSKKLQQAAYFGTPLEIQLLLAAGARPNSADSKGSACLRALSVSILVSESCVHAQ